MNSKRKTQTGQTALAAQLRDGSSHPFGMLRNFSPLGGGEEQVYREIREAVPVLDAAVCKLVRLCGGFTVQCRNAVAQRKLEEFLHTMPCGYCQQGMDAFLAGYLDSLLTYGRAVGEMILARDRLWGVCWGDVTALEICREGLNVELWGPDDFGMMHRLPRQNLLLFSVLNPEIGSPYGVSLFRGMPFLADILMKIYTTVGSNWERAGNVRYSVVCKDNDGADAMAMQERGKQVASEWSKAMSESKNGRVRDFVAVGDVEIKAIGGDVQVLDSQVPVRQILEQLIAKTGLPPFMLGLNWSTTERMSTQQADILTSELWAIRRAVEPVIRKVCKTFLILEGLDDRLNIVWDDISLQDSTEQAKADLYRAQAEKARKEG